LKEPPGFLENLITHGIEEAIMAIKIGMIAESLGSISGSFKAGVDRGAKFRRRPIGPQLSGGPARNGIGSCFFVTVRR